MKNSLEHQFFLFFCERRERFFQLALVDFPKRQGFLGSVPDFAGRFGGL